MNFQVTEQNNKNLKTSKLNRCIAFTSLSPSSTTTPPPTTTLTASLRSFSLLSLNFQIQGTLFPVLSFPFSFLFPLFLFVLSLFFLFVLSFPVYFCFPFFFWFSLFPFFCSFFSFLFSSFFFNIF